MINVQGTRKHFRWLAAYLVHGVTGTEQERVAWTAARNLPTDDPELAATFMRATAALSQRVEQPAYHLVVSFAPEDPVDRAMAERVADRVLERLGLGEHQAIIVAHRDRPHFHVHILVNRVHPETGRAWSSWDDWRLTEELLRAEERALGLREIPSWQRAPRARDPSVPDRTLDRGPAQRSDQRQAERQTVPDRRPGQTRTRALVRDLQAYDRVVDRIREQYRAQLDASAARARGARLEQAAERARTAQASLERALARVYEDPEQAHRAYQSATGDKGVTEATRLMRERPEHFGPLAVVERDRALGLLHTTDDRPARGAVPAAATAAREAIEAARAFRQVVGELDVRRAEQAFAHELGMIYQDPGVARTGFERVAGEHGAEPAAAALRDRPGTLGAVRPFISREVAWFEEQAARAAGRGVDVIHARASVATANVQVSEARLERDQTISRAEADRAAARDAAIGRELRTLPTRAALEHRLNRVLSRLSSRELQQLRRAVTAPQFAVAMQLRGVVRDIALGREEDAEQSRER